MEKSPESKPMKEKQAHLFLTHSATSRNGTAQALLEQGETVSYVHEYAASKSWKRPDMNVLMHTGVAGHELSVWRA
jgi:hypothetical protein